LKRNAIAINTTCWLSSRICKNRPCNYHDYSLSSPFLRNLTRNTAIKLMQLTVLFSQSKYLLSGETNYFSLQKLLLFIDNILLYQYDVLLHSGSSELSSTTAQSSTRFTRDLAYSRASPGASSGRMGT
jgi:hypothetical protein